MEFLETKKIAGFNRIQVEQKIADFIESDELMVVKSKNTWTTKVFGFVRYHVEIKYMIWDGEYPPMIFRS